MYLGFEVFIESLELHDEQRWEGAERQALRRGGPSQTAVATHRLGEGLCVREQSEAVVQGAWLAAL